MLALHSNFSFLFPEVLCSCKSWRCFSYFLSAHHIQHTQTANGFMTNSAIFVNISHLWFYDDSSKDTLYQIHKFFHPFAMNDL